MCDYVEEANFEEILRQRKLARKRLYLERCLQQQATPRIELRDDPVFLFSPCDSARVASR